MDVLKDEVDIVKELPSHLKFIDFEAIGSLVCFSLIVSVLYFVSINCLLLSEHCLKIFFLAFSVY